MPRRSAAELQVILANRQRTGRNLAVIPPKSLTTAAQRKTFKELLLRHPHVIAKPNCAGILANYVLLQARIRQLGNDQDLPERSAVARDIIRLEKFLGLPHANVGVRESPSGQEFDMYHGTYQQVWQE